MKYYLSIDAGTSIIKTVIFSQDFNIKYKSSIENKVQTDSKGKSEIDMRSFWSLTSKLIKSSLKKSKIKKKFRSNSAWIFTKRFYLFNL